MAQSAQLRSIGATISPSGPDVAIRPLTEIRSVHSVRPLNEAHVDRIAKSIEENGLQPFPLRMTPDGVLFAGAHRQAAMVRLGITEALISVEKPPSLDAVALADNAASEQSLPMTFVDHAELIWRKLAGGQTQQAVADEFGWKRGDVSNYAALGKIHVTAWNIIATAFSLANVPQADGGVATTATPVAFTEGLLRSILPLTVEQQFGLVSDLASGTIDKGKFKRLADAYRARNQMEAWLREGLAEVGDEDLVEAAVKQITEGRLDGEWKDGKPGPRLLRLRDNTLAAWRDKTSIRLVHGDFFEEVAKLGEASIDAVVTDPPYNISTDRIYRLNAQADWNKDFGTWDRHEPEVFVAELRRWADAFFRVMKPGASGFMFAGEDYIAPLKAALDAAGFDLKGTFYWCRSNPGTSVTKADFMPAMDFAVQFVKPGADRTWNYPGEPAGFNYRAFPICGGNERLKDAKGDTLHPTQKPLAVISHLIELITLSGDTVLDGFMGVGTTPAAAKALGRKCIGIERDKTFHAAAVNRMEKSNG